jgi:2-iminobutanoate/2-iminopropanoate deaminase
MVATHFDRVGTDFSLCHCLVATERIASYTRAANPEFIFTKDSNGGLAVNRRFGFLAVALVVAGIISVNGAFSQPAPQTTRKVFNAPEKTVQAPYSDGILAGNTLYLAGRIGLDPKTGKPPAEIEDEIKLMLDSLKGTLTQAGMTMDDLVYVQIACTDLSLFDKFNPIYKSYFKTTDYPAREFIGAGSLLRGGHFELQAIAVRR